MVPKRPPGGSVAIDLATKGAGSSTFGQFRSEDLKEGRTNELNQWEISSTRRGDKCDPNLQLPGKGGKGERRGDGAFVCVLTTHRRWREKG